MTTTGEGGHVSLPGSVTGNRERRPEPNPEVEPEEEGGQDGRPERELRLLEQLARMREMLSSKEAELAETRSELTYAQQETEAAKEELEGTQQELMQVRSETQTKIDRWSNQLEQQDKEFQAERLQGELRKMQEIEELRKDFDWERRQWHAMLEDRGSLPKRGAPVKHSNEHSHSTPETGEVGSCPTLYECLV